MTTLVPPRYELKIIDPKTGNMSREWYKFLVQLSKAVGASPTSADDLQALQNGDAAAIEAIALKAARDAQDAINLASLNVTYDQSKPDDLSLLAWWPGSQT